jgi:hypothetical protein
MSVWGFDYRLNAAALASKGLGAGDFKMAGEQLAAA